MNPFQVIILIVLVGLLVTTILAASRGWLSRRLAVVVSLLWIGGGLVSIRPNTTTDVAKLLGIGQGKDLLLYCAVLVMLVGFFMVYLRIRRLRGQLTEVVRQVAILRAEGPLGGSDASDPSVPG